MKQKIQFREFDSALMIFIFSTLLLLVPHLTRLLVYDSVMIGEESYYHARIAREMLGQGIPSYDLMVEEGRPYIFNLYHLTLAWFSSISSIDFASKFLPYFFGILSLFLFYIILKKFEVNLPHRFIISLILVASPVFVYTFTISSPLPMAIFLQLFAFWLFLKKSKISFAFSAVLFASAMFLGLLNNIIILLSLLAVLLFNQKQINKKRAFILFSILLAISLIFYTPFLLKYGLPEKTNFVQKSILRTYISDLGGNGFAVFAIILTLVGLIITWRNKHRFVFLYIIMIFLIIFSYFNAKTLIYLNFIFSVSAAYALMYMLKREWKLRIIKNLTIFILILGLIFSTISYLERIGHLQPDQNIIEGLEWLNKNSGKGEIVFSHYSNGFWIESIADRPVVMDEYFSYTAPNQRFNDSNQIFYNRNLEKTKSLLNKYNVKYIWIDPDMKRDQVWTKEKQGLLFLFRNNETFKNIYTNQGIEIWQYQREG